MFNRRERLAWAKTSRRGLKVWRVDSFGAGACGPAAADAVVSERADTAWGTQERGTHGGAGATAKRALGASVETSPGGGRGLE